MQKHSLIASHATSSSLCHRPRSFKILQLLAACAQADPSLRWLKEEAQLKMASISSLGSASRAVVDSTILESSQSNVLEFAKCSQELGMAFLKKSFPKAGVGLLWCGRVEKWSDQEIFAMLRTPWHSAGWLDFSTEARKALHEVPSLHQRLYWWVKEDVWSAGFSVFDSAECERNIQELLRLHPDEQ